MRVVEMIPGNTGAGLQSYRSPHEIKQILPEVMLLLRNLSRNKTPVAPTLLPYFKIVHLC